VTSLSQSSSSQSYTSLSAICILTQSFAADFAALLRVVLVYIIKLTNRLQARGVARNLFWMGTKQQDYRDRSPPAWSRGRALVEVWGPQKLKTYMLITIAIMC